MALDFIAGCFGGCAGIVVGHPLDTIKIRIQTQDFRNPQYKGTIDCFKSIVRNEKVSGLYKGMSSPLAGVALINAVVFGVYGNLQKNLPDPESLTSHFVAGTVAGLVQSFICSPMELVKTRVQIQQNKTFESPLRCLSHIRRTEGIVGVFKGLNMTLLREGLAFGVYFSVYEWLTRGASSKEVTTAHMLAAGGSSGAASWLCTYPLDVLKSRIQADGVSGHKKYKNSMDCLMKSARAEGFSFLFRGLSPTLLRAFPTNAATWAVVTWVMRLANSEEEIVQKQETFGELIEKKFAEDFPIPSFYSHDFSFLYNFYLKNLTDESS